LLLLGVGRYQSIPTPEHLALGPERTRVVLVTQSGAGLDAKVAEPALVVFFLQGDVKDLFRLTILDARGSGLLAVALDYAYLVHNGSRQIVQRGALVIEEERPAAQEREQAAAVDVVLGRNFNSIANAGSTSQANRVINETLDMFESPNTPVLLIIKQNAGFNDYDRPTTIEKYLNYVKDQKKASEKVHDIKYNANGKINELELIKK
jgi:hypothetical protein